MVLTYIPYYYTQHFFPIGSNRGCLTRFARLPITKFTCARVMKLEVFILGGQRIDQKRTQEWMRGRSERIEKGSRERIGIERKGAKVN